MENDTERMTMPRANAADAVPKFDPIHTARTRYRTVMDGEDHRVTLLERHNFWPRLHARALFGEHEFAAREVPFGFGQQNRDLERENVLAIEVLMQTVVIVRPVLKQQRGGPKLPRIMATRDVVCVFFRVANVDAHRGVPAIGYRRKTRVEDCAKAGDDIGQRIAEILVLSTAETMPSHHYPAAEDAVHRIQPGQRIALLPGDKIFDQRASPCIEVSRHPLPIEGA